MNLVISRPHLLSAISAVSQFSEATGLLTANQSVSILSGNRESGVRHTLAGAEMARPGETTIPITLLRDWLAQSAAERVRILATDDGSVVVHGTEHERLSLIAPDEVPSTAAPVPTSTTIQVRTTDFRNALNRVLFAAQKSPREARWATNAVQFGLSPTELQIAATDEIQLSVATLDGESGSNAEALVPVEFVKRWARVRLPEEFVTIAVWTGGVRIQCGPLDSWSRQAGGQFPKVVPPAHKHSCELSRAELLRAIRMAITGADPDPEDEMDPRLRFVALRLQAGSLLVRGETAGDTTSSVEMDLPQHKGPGLDMTLDGPRLVAYLKTIPEVESVEMRWSKKTAAISFAPCDRALFQTSGKSWYVTVPHLERKSE